MALYECYKLMENEVQRLNEEVRQLRGAAEAAALQAAEVQRLNDEVRRLQAEAAAAAALQAAEVQRLNEEVQRLNEEVRRLNEEARGQAISTQYLFDALNEEREPRDTQDALEGALALVSCLVGI